MIDEPSGRSAEAVLHSPAVDLSKLDKALIGGVFWTASARWISQIITWGITLIVARLLMPSDYGLIGMATIYLNITVLLSEFGIGTTIVTLRHLTENAVSQLNSVSLALGFIGFLISVWAANPVGKFFRMSGLPAVIIVMSLAFIISAFRTVPYSLLERDMRFKLLAVIDGLQSVTQAIVTLVLAFLGFRYWALAFGNLSVSVATTALTLIWRRQRFAWPRFSMLREPLVFSWHVIVGRLSWYAYDSSDFLIAGRVLGPAPLGAYSIAWTLAHVPLDKLTVLVNRVTPSVFAAIHSDFAALRRYLSAVTGGLALVIFPATLGMALVGKDFVYIALGRKWGMVVLPLELLALHGLIRSNVILLTPVLNALRETRFAMWTNVASSVILPGLFYMGSRWGTGGIASVWVLVYPLLQIPLFWRTFRRINLSMWDYFRSLGPALSGCTFMALAVEILKRMSDPGWPVYIHLAADILVGILAYALALIIFHHKQCRAYLRILKSV